MFSTTRHVSRSTEPGFKYFSEGPLISARASAKKRFEKQNRTKCFNLAKEKKGSMCRMRNEIGALEDYRSGQNNDFKAHQQR